MNKNQVPHKYPNLPPRETNPSNQPTGDFTGRCYQCGSDNLWDDNLHYGCNNCGMVKFARG